MIAPDDPSYFNSFASNDDFYYAAIGPEFDLKDLKVCIKNSIFCSLAGDKQKKELWQFIEAKWNVFIDEFL